MHHVWEVPPPPKRGGAKRGGQPPFAFTLGRAGGIKSPTTRPGRQRPLWRMPDARMWVATAEVVPRCSHARSHVRLGSQARAPGSGGGQACTCSAGSAHRALAFTGGA